MKNIIKYTIIAIFITFMFSGCSSKKDPRGHSGLSAIRGWRDGSHDGRDLSIL